MKKLKEKVKIALVTVLIAMITFGTGMVFCLTLRPWKMLIAIEVILGCCVLLAIFNAVSYCKEYIQAKRKLTNTVDTNENNQL